MSIEIKMRGTATEIGSQFGWAHAFHDGLSEFKCLPQDLISWIWFPLASLYPSGPVSGQHIELSHDSLLPHNFQFYLPNIIFPTPSSKLLQAQWKQVWKQNKWNIIEEIETILITKLWKISINYQYLCIKRRFWSLVFVLKIVFISSGNIDYY